MEGLGGPQGDRSLNAYDYVPGGGDPGRVGGGTYTNPRGNGNRDPTIQDYENIFGPAARDIKMDLQRNKRHARWHLPDVLRGSNPYLADRIDGLITDTTSSPFTTVILPYKYIENVDQKIKWNAWSFDEGLASRVPYESAARTLTQTKRSYAGYTIRHGLAITMEHNFMMSEKGRENFKNQLQQVVGSIQYTNDLDVHIALITAVSYAKERAEKYYTSAKTNHQIIREYIDLFGFMSKNPNAMDILIEEAKAILRIWGASDPDFLLTNSKLTFQMTMTPDKTQYLTQGPDGVRKLRDGPNIASYRGLKIINSRAFSMEEGAPPRDVLRRRVRVAEYYRIPYEQGIEEKSFAFYDESKDAWQKFTWNELYRMAHIGDVRDTDDSADWDDDNEAYESRVTKLPTYQFTDPVDIRLSRELLDRMTVGDIRPANGGVRTGPGRPLPQGGVAGNAVPVEWEVMDEGNMVLNPWYALFRIDAGDGSEVPGWDAGAVRNVVGAPATRTVDALRFRQGWRPAGAPTYPATGVDFHDDALYGDFTFKPFAKYIEAFGYKGEMDFSYKPQNMVDAYGQQEYTNDINNGGNPVTAAAARDAAVARMKTGAGVNALADANYRGQLDQNVWDGSLRGHPDYSHPSYRVARYNFHQYLMMYLFGRADYIPAKAREFFDNFNWQRFGNQGGNPMNAAQRLSCFAEILGRIYDTSLPPAPAYPGAVGRPIGQPFPVANISQRLTDVKKDLVELVIIRPNIEHNMLGIILGRGGLDELGATFWGQTELSCYDDSMHGIWGMSYKYNEKAIVLNQKNLIRLWDIAYDGYNGGKDCTQVSWTDMDSVGKFKDDTYEINKPYEGASMMVMAFKNIEGGDPWPSPIVFHDPLYKNTGATIPVDGENCNFIKMDPFRVFNRASYQDDYKNYYNLMPDFSKMHNTKTAGTASEENESQLCALAFQGTMKVYPGNGAQAGAPVHEISGSGHHGIDYVGVASVRAGKGMRMGPVPDSSVVKIM